MLQFWPILNDPGEFAPKWTRVFTTRRWVILVARTRRKKIEENTDVHFSANSPVDKFRVLACIGKATLSRRLRNIQINLSIFYFELDKRNQDQDLKSRKNTDPKYFGNRVCVWRFLKNYRSAGVSKKFDKKCATDAWRVNILKLDTWSQRTKSFFLRNSLMYLLK